MTLAAPAPRSAPHLFVDISAHGLGHLAQVAPILNRLRQSLPELRLSVRSGIAPARLRARLHGDFAHLEASSDFGYVMHDAVDIDLAASAAAYRQAHADWPRRVAAEADFLARLSPDLVLSNVAYLPLAGAAQAGIPALAMCSLNWADLFAHFFGRYAWAAPILAEMTAAYAGAERFLRLTPAMAMPSIRRLLDTRAVAGEGCARRAALRAHLGCPQDAKLVLIAFGGFAKALPLADWPLTPGVFWVFPEPAPVARADAVTAAGWPYPFADLLRSVDAVLTKPGYGTFVEAACSGIPLLYLRRPDWPEQDALIDWLHAHARTCEISADTLQRGHFGPQLSALWAQNAPPPPHPEGVEEIAEFLAARLAAGK